MNFIKEIQVGINGVTDEDMKKYAPTNEIKEGEEVLGVLTEGQQKLYVFVGKKGEEGETLLKDAEKLRGDNTDEATKKLDTIAKAMRRLAMLAKITRTVMWDDIEMTFDVSDNDIGIRKDWQVVKLPETKRSSIEIISILGPFSFSS